MIPEKIVKNIDLKKEKIPRKFQDEEETELYKWYKVDKEANRDRTNSFAERHDQIKKDYFAKKEEIRLKAEQKLAKKILEREEKLKNILPKI